MASRAELVQICDELNINCEDLNIEEMKQEIKDWADKRIHKIKYKRGETHFSKTFIKFITEEYDYVLLDKEGNQHSYKEVEDG